MKSFFLLVGVLLAVFSADEVQSSDTVRLQGGGSFGLLQVVYNGVWGTVCDDGWSITNTHVVCRQLGFAGALNYMQWYGVTGQIWLDDVRCSGNESAIQQCRHNGWGRHDCRHNEDVFVICNTTECSNYTVLNTADRAASYKGITNKCDKNDITKGWYRFMGDAGTIIATTCVPSFHCGTNVSGWMQGSLPNIFEGIVNRTVCYTWNSSCCYWSNNVRVRNCGEFYTYELVKTPRCFLRYCGANLNYTVRIQGGGSSGRLQVLHNGTWGTVCVDEWSMTNTHVVCRQLGFAGAWNYATTNGGTGQIWLDNVRCSGNESAIQQCSHLGWGKHNCDHDEDVAVICNTTDTVRIQGGGSSGRLQVLYYATWGTVCDNGWSIINTHVVCRQLGFAGALNYHNSGGGTGQIWLEDVRCSGSESAIQQCSHGGWGEHNCGHHEDVFVNCTTNDSCHSSPCRNNGACYNAIGGTYKCSCRSGYTGQQCQSYVNFCASGPCSNGGTCNNTSNYEYQCSCPYGFTGRQCETTVNFCASDPCRNGGTCNNNYNKGYNCSCPYGFIGRQCETNVTVCASEPCRNGGTCNNTSNNGYNCSCPFGFTGRQCETKGPNENTGTEKQEGEEEDSCNSNPCRNNGTCYNVGGTYNCSCPYGYTGQQCQSYVNLCASGPCSNGGTCNNIYNNGYNCSCPYGFTGRQCETKGPNENTGTEKQEGEETRTCLLLLLSVAVALAVVLLLVLIFFILVILKKAQRLSPLSSSYSPPSTENSHNQHVED